MDPITRKEMFLAKAGGQSVRTPEPITREEMFLKKIAENGGSGAVSWNDLTDKPEGVGYTEKAVLFPEATLESNASQYVLPNFIPVVGDTYEVKIDGVSYTSTAINADLTGEGSVYGPLIAAGDFAIAWSPIAAAQGFAGAVMMNMAGAAPASVIVEIKGPKVVKIPTKYIDHTFWVDVFATDNGDGSITETTTLTPRQLYDAVNAGRPVIMRYRMDTSGEKSIAFLNLSITQESNEAPGMFYVSVFTHGDVDQILHEVLLTWDYSSNDVEIAKDTPYKVNDAN